MPVYSPPKEEKVQSGLDESFKRKAVEQRESLQPSSSVKREEDSKKRTKREAPKEIPKGASARKELVKSRKINKTRKKTPNSRNPNVSRKGKPQGKEEVKVAGQPADQRGETPSGSGQRSSYHWRKGWIRHRSSGNLYSSIIL